MVTKTKENEFKGHELGAGKEEDQETLKFLGQQIKHTRSYPPGHRTFEMLKSNVEAEIRRDTHENQLFGKLGRDTYNLEMNGRGWRITFYDSMKYPIEGKLADFYAEFTKAKDRFAKGDRFYCFMKDDGLYVKGMELYKPFEQRKRGDLRTMTLTEKDEETLKALGFTVRDGCLKIDGVKEVWDKASKQNHEVPKRLSMFLDKVSASEDKFKKIEPLAKELAKASVSDLEDLYNQTPVRIY